MKRKFSANTIIGYDEKGKVVMKYWQKDPIISKPFLFKLPWYVKYNPIWRIQQWWWLRQTIVIGG